MLYQVIHPTDGRPKTDGNLSTQVLLILLLGGSLYKFGAMLAAEMGMLCKERVVIRAMAEGVCPILPHRSVRQLMSLVV